MPDIYRNIHGWFDFSNLYEDLLLNKLPDNSNFAEIGCWGGKSVCYLAELAKKNNRRINIFAIDIFADELDKEEIAYKIRKNSSNIYTHFLQNMSRAGVLDIVTPIALFSEDASKMFYNNYFDCVFLDAAHDEENVINDLNHWIPKIKIGGYLAAHDYIDGIKPFVDKYFDKIEEKVETILPHCFLWKKNKEIDFTKRNV